ncbi:MAG TPA: hypothetical protein VNO30_32250 [Kofleriaceae bacterium]|nr:hypothetical protein [Kofleriaceae bacterium]
MIAELIATTGHILLTIGNDITIGLGEITPVALFSICRIPITVAALGILAAARAMHIIITITR